MAFLRSSRSPPALHKIPAPRLPTISPDPLHLPRRRHAFRRRLRQQRSRLLDEFIHAFTLAYRHPLALTAGLPFALTLLAILLAHELGHFFACRHHHIHSRYPFFIPFPTLIGTLGAFILIRSPIRTTRALFDVGASGPLVGFLVAVPALIYGIVHA